MSWDNEPLSSITHLVGFLLAIAGLVLLIVFAAIYATPWHVVGFSIFGAAMILLYATSTLYHFFPLSGKAKKVFQKIDHSMVYVLIAGTYTPICLVPLRGGLGWSLFGIIWAIAILGIVYKSTTKKINTTLATLLYLAMGWLIVIAFFPLVKSLPSGGVWWLIAGGLAYTFGVVFFALEMVIPRKRWFGMHEIWHIFVMAGSFCHFWLMLKFVLWV